ncbi:ATP-binding protein [Pseudomonas sp. 102515]|uniref:AAA family ATPase n=1 Tax=Pseudomonas sp. 102515 TaxID=3071568 RepID=UPI002800F688|nr:ATP-binding protein [Pseudomonas sp. 102515]MDQ7914695.1 ATP-binding protein [Pseudomonas sp. 102515]
MNKVEKVKIKKIEIKNYRSCIDTQFEPNSGLSSLIGPNGSGKTTILSAFQLLNSLSTSRYQNHRKNSPDSFSSDCLLKVTFEWETYKITYEAKVNLVNNEKNEDEVLNSRESWSFYQITKSRKKINLPISIILENYRYSGHDIRKELAEFLGNFYRSEQAGKLATEALHDIAHFAQSISYYSASIFTNPSSCPISFEVESESGARRGISITGHKKFLYDLYDAYKKDSDEYNHFIELVGPEGLNLIDGLSFQEIQTSASTYKVTVGGHITTKEKKNNLIIPNFKILENSLSPSQLSEGTFRTLGILFYLIKDHSPLMLIEEPEVCVHHGLLSSIIQLIKLYAQEKQIIISTHSDQLLDHLEIESVFKVDRTEEGTKIENIKKRLSNEELKALREYLRNEGGLGEYWKHGAL